MFGSVDELITSDRLGYKNIEAGVMTTDCVVLLLRTHVGCRTYGSRLALNSTRDGHHLGGSAWVSLHLFRDPLSPG